jgi:hypothetical protein
MSKAEQEVKIDSSAPVHKIVLWYRSSDHYLTCIQLFAKDGRKLLESGWLQSKRVGCHFTEQTLREGERIIGIKAR